MNSIIDKEIKWFIIGVNTAKLTGNTTENTGFSIPIIRFIKLYEKSKELLGLRPSFDFNYQIITQLELSKQYRFSASTVSNSSNKFTKLKPIRNLYIKPTLGVRITELNKNSYLRSYFDVNDIILCINDKLIRNGFVSISDFSEKISLNQLNLWFNQGDILKIKILRKNKYTKLFTVDDVKVVLEYQKMDFRYYFYPLLTEDKYFLEKNNLILSIFTKEHYLNLSDLQLNLNQIINLINTINHCKDAFTIYLSGVNPNIYTTDTFSKYPIGDIIVEINDIPIKSYDDFMKLDKIMSIKTINNELYYIEN
jgi:hypothetical protein